MKEPIIKKLNDTDRPIVSLALSSTTLSPAELTRLADPGITRELRSLPGVADVLVFGKQERELTVELKPQALQAVGVSVGQVVQALQLQNLASPVGRVTGALDERSIRLQGAAREPGGVHASRRRRAKRPADSPRPGRRDQRRHRGAAHARAVQQPRGGGHRHQEGEGLQHDRRREPAHRARRPRSRSACRRARRSRS